MTVHIPVLLFGAASASLDEYHSFDLQAMADHYLPLCTLPIRFSLPLFSLPLYAYSKI